MLHLHRLQHQHRLARGDLAAVCEELAAQGCPLLMMIVSPAICGTVVNRYGTTEQKQRWLPGI